MRSDKINQDTEDTMRRNKEIKEAFSPRRALARIALVLLVGCVIATLVCALTHQSGSLILALLFCDMAIPIFFYLAQWIAKVIESCSRDD